MERVTAKRSTVQFPLVTHCGVVELANSPRVGFLQVLRLPPTDQKHAG